MSAEVLREAAGAMRHEARSVRRPYGRDERVAEAVADLLDVVASGDTDRESDWSHPSDLRAALAVARAYLSR